MRLSDERLAEIILIAERMRPKFLDDNRRLPLEDGRKLTLDYRDTREAVKILRDRLDKAQEEIKMLRGLSESQAKALNMMEMGRL